MARVHRTEPAKRDYHSIWSYIAERNVTAADRLLRKIDEKLDAYAEWPGMGRLRTEFGPAIRTFTVGDYVVFYRPVQDGIELLRVIHGMRDLHRAFRSDET